MRFLPLLLCACASPAQAAELTVETLQSQSKNTQGQAYLKDQMTLPLVKAKQAGNKANANIARKINTRLSFIDVAGAESQQFKVSRNDARILTIAFDTEDCGAYCESHRSWYSFDLQDGSLLTAANLFTPKGLRALAARQRQEQITRYRQQLGELAINLKASQAESAGPDSKASQTNQDIISDLESRIELNKSCLDDQLLRAQESANQQAPTLFDSPGYAPFEITEKAFELTGGRCSNHASRALDDVGDVTLSLPFPQLAPWLTAYGKSVLLNVGRAPPEERIFGQVLYGTLAGKSAITMLIEKQDASNISGLYFYNRFRTPIALAGTLTGQILALKESSEPPPGQAASDATLRLSRIGNALHGQWASKTSNKQFEVRLAP